MAYLTIDALKLKFGQDVTDLLDRDGNGVEDVGVADMAINDASAEIDTIIGQRFAVPVVDAPWLSIACADIARYRLYDDSVPESVKDRYDAAIKQLRDIAAGKAGLINSSGAAIEDLQTLTSTVGAVSEAPRVRIFDDTTLSGFVGQ